MKLYKTKTWSALDIALLIGCCCLIGMIAGACLSVFTMRHVWIFATVAVLLIIKPVATFLRIKR